MTVNIVFSHTVSQNQDLEQSSFNLFVLTAFRLIYSFQSLVECLVETTEWLKNLQQLFSITCYNSLKILCNSHKKY